MAYERYFIIKGKRYGPYYYESYRDKTGKVRKRYVQREKLDKIKKKDLTSKNKFTKIETSFDKKHTESIKKVLDFKTIIFLDKKGIIRSKKIE